MSNTVNESAIKKLKLLFTIVDRPKGEFYLDVISQFDVNFQMATGGLAQAAVPAYTEAALFQIEEETARGGLRDAQQLHSRVQVDGLAGLEVIQQSLFVSLCLVHVIIPLLNAILHYTHGDQALSREMKETTKIK